MLLRGTDTFFMWCSEENNAEETKLVQEVYAAAQEYGRFLDHGIPINFDVPDKPGTVVSGLVLDNEVLVRRTDFSDDHSPVRIMAGTKEITVNYSPGTCSIIKLN
jgi:hypothetical protein